MSYSIEVHDCAGAFGSAERETFTEAIAVARTARQRWPSKAITVVNLALADDRGDGLTSEERDAVLALDTIGGAWSAVRAIAHRLVAAGYGGDEIREQMHGWVDDAVTSAAREAG